MAVRDAVTMDVKETSTSNLLDGVAIAVVSPIVIPALLLGLRPVAKTVLKGSLVLTNQVRQWATSTSAGWRGLVAEARVGPNIARMSAPPAAAGERPPQAPEGEETDLQSLRGVGTKFAELLTAAGVESIRALARRNPANLHEKLVQVNEQQHIVYQPPSLELVTAWIEQAQTEEV
jgi:predicted flap endonuclease-1-like 5' DNA nuclease